MPSGYVPNPEFVEGYLYRSAALGAALKVQAALAAASAQDLAHAEAFDASHQGDHYADSIVGDRVAMDGGRITAFVDARDFKAHWIEWGTVYQNARHIVQRGVERVLGSLRGG